MVAVERLTATPGGHRSKSTLVVRSSQKRPPRIIATTPARHRSQPTRAASTGANQKAPPESLMSWKVHRAMIEDWHGHLEQISNEIRAKYKAEVQELRANDQRELQKLHTESLIMREELQRTHFRIHHALEVKHQANLARRRADRHLHARRKDDAALPTRKMHYLKVLPFVTTDIDGFDTLEAELFGFNDKNLRLDQNFNIRGALGTLPKPSLLTQYH